MGFAPGAVVIVCYSGLVKSLIGKGPRLFTDIGLKLARWHASREHLVDFLQRAVAGFRNEEVDKCGHDNIGAEPDISVLGGPVEIGRVDEVWSGKSAQPVEQEVGGGSDTKDIGSKGIVGVLATNEPGIRGIHGVGEGEEGDEGNHNLS